MAQIRVLAYTLPGKPDNSSKAFFENTNRAEQYAMMLINSGDYNSVSITDHLNQQHWIEKPEVQNNK